MANPHAFPPYGVGINPAALSNPAPQQQNPFFTGSGQQMTNPAMLAALQQQARYAQMKQQQQQQQQQQQHQHQQQQHQQQQQQQHQQQQQQGPPNMAFNPAQLQLTPPNHVSNQSLVQQIASMTPHERQIAQAKVMAQQQQQQYSDQQQQQQYGYDARMMPPPPPPAQRSPSARPGPMQRPLYPGQQQPQFQQQQQQQPRFPMHGFDAQQQIYPQQQQQPLPQQQQQQPQQQQHFPSHVPPAVNMNMGNMTPAQLQQLQHLHAHSQAQGAQQQSPPHAQDPRLTQLHAMQAQAQAQSQSPLPLHPHSQSQSPSARKRKLPPAQPLSSTTPSAAAQNINPNVQRMMDPFAQSGVGMGLAPPRRQSSQPPPPAAAAPRTPPPAPATLNPAFTRITTLPLAGSLRTIPPLPAAAIANMHTWIARDKAYEGAWTRTRERAREELADAVKRRAGWWEDAGDRERDKRGASRGERFALLWPEQKRHARVRKMKRAGVRWEGVRIPSKLQKEAAERPEDLVPIRLELDVEHHKLRETFVWNVNDPLITPEIFAQSVIDDFKLAQHHAPAIVKAIQEQLHEPDADADAPPAPVDQPADPACGALEAADEAWWTFWRKRIRTEDGYVRVGGEDDDADADVETEDEGGKKRRRARRRRRARTFGVMVPDVMGEAPMDVDELQVENKGVDEEMRILIKLDILVGTMKLDDQFEWDVSCASNSPEHFATLYTTELGLPGEFTTAIAHQIREQVHAFRKTGLAAADDDDLRPAFLPPLTRGSLARTVDAAGAHMPLLNYMSDGEIERTERERDKELKRKRRHARGRALGVRGAVPDRTHRTPGIGFPESDNAALQAAQAANVPTTSRRAAAAAASLTIANMVASENGGSPMQLSMPEPVRQVPSAREAAAAAAKKAAARAPVRLFKAPAYPPAALRARAHVVAPTPHTGLDPTRYRPAARKQLLEQGADEQLQAAPPPPPPVPAKLTAKQIRDLEKEAKEKEYAEGQHENFIDGVWHCSNCGCPETIAVGRRKGPLGDKSQCGPCGKFYHRHRRPRPCEYHAEESYHTNLKVEADRAKAVNRRKGGAAALRAMNQEATSAPESSTSVINLKGAAGGEQDDGEDDEDRPEESKDEPEPINAADIVGPPESSAAGAASPADTTSSEEPPLALAKSVSSKINGSAKPRSAPKSSTSVPAPASTSTRAQSPTPPPPATKPMSQSHPPSEPQLQQSPETAAATISPTPAKPVSVRSTSRTQMPRPEWLKNALDAMQSRYPDDKFDVVLRKTTDVNAQAEWRVKCLDCPGKLYTPGPAETLTNFEVHLKNRFHRAKVNARVLGISPPPS